MNCRHFILANNMFFFVMIHTDTDYMKKSQVKRSEWLNPLRYEITFRFIYKYRIHKNFFTLNDDAWLNRKWANFNWRYGISCKLGIHFIPRGTWEGDGKCIKCGKQAVEPWNDRPPGAGYH